MRGRPAETTVSSRLLAQPERVWERIITPEGINAELRPYLRMTVPRGIDRIDLDSIELGKPLGRSWILLFGLIPFDYDEITLVRLEEGRGFLERSKMLSQRTWEHERTLEPAGAGGCLVTDRLRWEPRLGLPGAPLRPVIHRFFRHRHRQLRKQFGGVEVN
jgi:ligand-binding SRPBCC domain-containing protein